MVDAPKSASFTLPESSTRIFPPLISLCKHALHAHYMIGSDLKKCCCLPVHDAIGMQVFEAEENLTSVGAHDSWRKWTESLQQVSDRSTRDPFLEYIDHTQIFVNLLRKRMIAVSTWWCEVAVPQRLTLAPRYFTIFG